MMKVLDGRMTSVEGRDDTQDRYGKKVNDRLRFAPGDS